MSLRQRILHLLIAVDQLVYVLITLGGGYPDETMSAAAWRVERQGRIFGRIFRPLIDALFFALTLGTEREHCVTKVGRASRNASARLRKLAGSVRLGGVGSAVMVVMSGLQ